MGTRSPDPPGPNPGPRPRLAIVGLWATLAACAPPPFDEVGYQTVKREFDSLSIRWDREAAQVRPPASREEYWRGPASGEILALGKVALPFVIEQIRQGNFYFNYAAEKITGIPLGHELRFEADRSSRWLEWWGLRERDPAWNVFVR